MIPYHTTPHRILSHHATPHHNPPLDTTPHHTIPHHTTPHHTSLHHITPHATPHHTAPCAGRARFASTAVAWHHARAEHRGRCVWRLSRWHARLQDAASVRLAAGRHIDCFVRRGHFHRRGCRTGEGALTPNPIPSYPTILHTLPLNCEYGLRTPPSQSAMHSHIPTLALSYMDVCRREH